MPGAQQERVQPKVLVIDDDKMTHQLLEAILRKGGYKCVSALRGEEGLELARATKPQLIILDIMMPGLNGFEVMKYLKASPTTASIPVIFLTGQVHQADKSQAKNLGAVDYMEKPFERQELLNRIDSYVSAKRQERNIAYYNDRLTKVAMEALALLTSSDEVEVSLDVPPEETFNRLIARIDDAHEILSQLVHKWPDLADLIKGQDQGFPLDLAELGEALTEVRDLAERLHAISAWPAV
ncbi:MAG: response regulator [Deltaproteobacteria bacterium]|jgi:DNA-binding response OmpR family regulator|nr:response regulator [Deltaproteobacteria bacterium]